jgi:GH25 family lysozyme M1 (1,4-beta-N-acetylmuramidase)/uncharacterized protein YjdB
MKKIIDDDEYIVEYRNGDTVSEEYDTENVAEEISETQHMVGDNNVEEYDDEGYSDDAYDEYAEDTGNYYSDNESDVDNGAINEPDEYSADYGDGYGDEQYGDEYYEAEYYEDEYYEDEYYEEYSDEDSFDTGYKGIDRDYEEDDDNNTYSGFFDRVKDILSRFTVLDAILAGTGVVIVVAAIVIISMTLQTKNINNQIEAIMPLGEELSTIGIVGEQGLLAMSDAALNGLFVTEESSVEEMTTEISSEVSTSKVSVNFTSVEKDLKIRFTDAKTGELIKGTAFEVTLTDSSGKKTVLTDDDKDGVIYKDNMTPGEYDAVITSTDTYSFPTTAQKVTVKKKVEYVVINNIQDEVKTEKQVNVAVEDTQQNDAVKEEEVLTDTVEYVEETKTPVANTETYLLIDKTTIADPSQVSKLSSRMLFDNDNVVIFDKTSATLKVGENIKVNITTSPKEHEDDDYKYSYSVQGWSSSNTNVATVSDGTVTAVGVGEATITYTVNETRTEKTKTDQPSSSETESSSEKQSSSETESSSEKQSESQDNTGVTANGDSEPEARSVYPKDTLSGDVIQATFTVKVEAATATITSGTLELKKSADTCPVGSTITVSPSKLTYKKSDGSSETVDSNFPTVSWVSSDTSIATVDNNGTVKGVKKGKVSITGKVTANGGVEISASTNVEITDAKELTLVLDKTKDVYIKVGGTTTITATVTNYKSDSSVTWTTSDSKVATVDEKGVVTGVSVGSVTITATTKEKNSSDKNVTATCVVTVNSDAVNDKVTKLKDKNGNQIYIKNSDGTYVEAVYADYYTATEFYIKGNAQYTYTGWQTIDGKTYYFDKNGNPVTGTQIIQGVTYNFDSTGAIATTVNGSTFGIDVSRHNGTIDWNAVKASGVDFVIIRCGYRGSSTGALIEDQNFKTNIKGATAAGLKVGVYVFSQAINEVEAVKEASLAVSLVKGYNLTYPIFIDTESSGGRADQIDKATRTAVVNAFCQTVIAGGYKAGVYASKSWYEDNLNVSALGNYKIWLAQYAAAPTYKSKYDMWQYSSKGKISGINGNVDLNYSYLGY